MRKPVAIALLLIGGAALKLALSVSSCVKDRGLPGKDNKDFFTERNTNEPQNRTAYQKY